MRTLLVAALITGCGHGHGGEVRPQAVEGGRDRCDVGEAARSTRRAWLVSAAPAHRFVQPPIAALGRDPAVVVELEGGDVLLAAVSAEVIVTRWAPVEALGRAVTDEIAVSPARNSAPDPALRVLPGFPLARDTTPWIAVHAAGQMQFTGFVPASVRGTIWDEPPPPTGSAIGMTFAVHASADAHAPVRAVIGPGARARANGHDIGTWVPIIATADRAVVEGFVERPPPTPTRASEHEIEFSELEVEGSATAWLAIGTCLRDAPHGEVVGAVVGPQWTRPRVEAGMTAITVTTPWGDRTYYTDAPIVEPAPPSSETWPFDSEWRN